MSNSERTTEEGINTQSLEPFHYLKKILIGGPANSKQPSSSLENICSACVLEYENSENLQNYGPRGIEMNCLL